MYNSLSLPLFNYIYIITTSLQRICNNQISRNSPTAPPVAGPVPPRHLLCCVEVFASTMADGQSQLQCGQGPIEVDLAALALEFLEFCLRWAPKESKERRKRIEKADMMGMGKPSLHYWINEDIWRWWIENGVSVQSIEWAGGDHSEKPAIICNPFSPNTPQKPWFGDGSIHFGNFTWHSSPQKMWLA